MKKVIGTILTVLVIIGLSVASLFLGNFYLTDNQSYTLLLLAIVCGGSILYCFVVGELTGNNSQMDKLWSLLPIAYVWIIAIRGGMTARLIVNAVIVTLWGIRLTFNFARKGAYRLKFWEGEEDYRWAILRKNKLFQNRFAWSMFDLFFISIYQNVLILAFCLPSLAYMNNPMPFNWIDYIAAGLALAFLLLETIADEQQWKFYKIRGQYYKEGKKLEEMPSPYNLGFNTSGLWGIMRHPNYLGEQGIWLSLYIFVIGSGAASYGIFHWTIIGPLFLILLFLGSSTMGEGISSGKYPKYALYQEQVFKYLPVRRFQDK